MAESHPLLTYFIDAVEGRFPPADDVHAQGPDGLGASLAPDFTPIGAEVLIRPGRRAA